MFSYIGLVIFAHAAHARVGKENFQYLPKPNCCICLEHLPIHVSHAYYLKYVRKVIDPSSPSMRQNFMAAFYHTR